MPADPAVVKALFLEAAAIDDPAARAALLKERCGADAALLARVQALLSANDRAVTNEVTASLASAEGSDALVPTADYPGKDEHVGAVIAGKYTLVEVIGEGGMGSVWRAKQTDPVKRFVAVKLIKAGMDSKQVLARFEAERQALALMDHPNIAKVLDGGLHEHRPFFVMELVKGVPITDYCDKLKLTPQQRLELFVQVCQAIQHAHQKGIIHRDIKPSNVLIALYDDKPVVKVIDFGVAKATGGSLTEKTIDTGFGGVVGTPQYMSPEQATFNNLDIDTRSDVYALGVLLYELLTGSTPFSKKELEKKGLLEILRVVREEEPPRPSTKLSTADALPTLSANRGTEPKKLTGLLRNELDWIVMKSLEKDRARRYETANGFAADINRYLGGEAVLAHPPSTAYRLKKFVRRNKGQVVAVSLVLLALFAGIVGTTWGYLTAENARLAETEQRRTAENLAVSERRAKLDAENQKILAQFEELNAKKQRERAEYETNNALRRLKHVEKGNEILGSVFAGLDPKRNYATLGELTQALKKNLKKAVTELDGSAIGDPLTVAEMQNSLGLSLLGLGDARSAVELFEKSSATRKAKFGPDHRDTLTSMNNLATAYQADGRVRKAIPLFETALEKRKATLGADHPDTLVSMNNLAEAYRDDGQVRKAIPLFVAALGKFEATQGEDHPDTLVSMHNLARAYQADGRVRRAIPLFETALEKSKATRGEDHPFTLTSMNNLALAYHADGQVKRAIPLHEAALEKRKTKLGEDHPDTLTSMNNLACAYHADGQVKKAIPLFETALAKLKATREDDHFDTFTCMSNLAEAYRDDGQVRKAIPLHEAALEKCKATRGEDHFDTLNCMSDLGAAYAEAKQGEKAAATFAEFVTGRRKTAPKDDPRFADVLARVSRDLLKCEQYSAAETLLRECLSIREKKQPDLWTTFNTQSMLGAALLGQKKYADAEPLLLKGYEGMKQREKTIPLQGVSRLPEALDRLIELYTATNKPDEAKKWQAERAKYPAPVEKGPPPREKK